MEGEGQLEAVEVGSVHGRSVSRRPASCVLGGQSFTVGAQFSARLLLRERPTNCRLGRVRLGAFFFVEHIEPLMRAAWHALCDEFPDVGLEMPAAAGSYGLASTRFTKTTVALNNPTPLHYDRGNFGVTALVSFDVTGLDDELRGGSHAFFWRRHSNCLYGAG
eukprot:6181894-Pleurochrysis_carterae.AAC.1